jgi:STE24 endopeptidase
MWLLIYTTAQSPDTVQGTGVPVPEPSELALRYYRSSHPIWLAGTALDLLVPAALLFTGFSSKLRARASRLGRQRWLPTVAIYGVLFVAVTSLASLPLAWYAGFLREHSYGLSQQSIGQWFGDWVKAVALGCLVAALGLWLPYLLLRVSPRRWWLWTSLAAAPLVVFLLMITPVWVDPLFNKFGPMRDHVLEGRILTLAARAGIEGGRVYEVNKSEDTKKVNAYVTGVGGTKRIVLWDTLVDQLTPDEVLFVMGHEMGHFVLHHVLNVILVIVFLIFLSLYAVHRIAEA